MSTLRLLVASIALLVSSVTEAGMLAAKKSTDVVRLTTSGASCTVVGGTRVDSVLPTDGTAAVPFEIPAGKVLVVTGVSWNFYVPPAASLRTLRVVLVSFVPPANLFALVADEALVGSGANGVAKSSAVPNVVVKPGVEMCASVDSITDPSAVVYGFLAPDK